MFLKVLTIGRDWKSRLPCKVTPLVADALAKMYLESSLSHFLCPLGDLRIAVNLSPRQFAQPGLAQSVAATLRETGRAAELLELELTERLVMADVDNAILTLGALKQLGVQIAIDDFGTGHSSLSYLRRFPIDILKIDQSFVGDITLAEDGAAIVRTIISLAHSLRLCVIAEGVETSEQQAYLMQHGCDQAQGYLIGRPVPAAEFEAIMRHRWSASIA